MDNQPVSWEPQVIADNSGHWTGNAVRLATEEEAKFYVQDLMMRWMLVRETRVIPSTDPVNYRWTSKGLERLEEPVPPGSTPLS